MLLSLVFMNVSLNVIGQVSTETLGKTGFEEYCEYNALRIVQIPTRKHVEFNDSVLYVDGQQSSPRLSSYNIKPMESKTTYYKLKDSSKMLVVSSLYRMRLSYTNEKNNNKK